MSILAKDCPECGETNPAYAVRCRCGYEFNETVDCGEEDDDLALTVQEEELYLEYLNARAQQASTDAQRAAQAAADQPNNKAAASQAERAQMVAQTAKADFESQQARVATAVKALKGNNSASPLANSGSVRQTSAPAISQALPSTAAPPRTPPKPTVSPTPTAKSERPANATSPVTSSTPVNKPSNVQVTAATRTPSAHTANTEPRKAGGGPGTPAPTTRGVAETTASTSRDSSATAATPDPSATLPANSKPAEDERAAVPTASATSATENSAVRGKPMDVPKNGAQDNDKHEDLPKKPTSAVPVATSKAAVADTSSSKQQDAASAKALAAAARAKQLTEKLKAAQAARAAKAQAASADPPVEKTAPSTKTTPPKSGAAMQTSAPTPPAAAKPANGQHCNGYDKLVADLNAIEVPGAGASEGESIVAPAASIEPTRSEPDVKDLGGTAPAAPAAPSGPVAPTVTVSVAPRIDPQEELEAALRALTTSTSTPVSNEPTTASPVETLAAARPPQARAAETKPAAVAPSVPADKKDCPNCTALLPLAEMRCRCGYTFPTVDETMPALSLSDSDIAAIGDESPRDRITHLS